MPKVSVRLRQYSRFPEIMNQKASSIRLRGRVASAKRDDETEITLAVRDGGPGIPLAELERIFDKFHRAVGGDSQAAYGYGLGLYVCRRIVEAQGGRVWAENAPGGGAVFSFTLPVAQR